MPGESQPIPDEQSNPPLNLDVSLIAANGRVLYALTHANFRIQTSQSPV